MTYFGQGLEAALQSKVVPRQTWQEKLKRTLPTVCLKNKDLSNNEYLEIADAIAHPQYYPILTSLDLSQGWDKDGYPAGRMDDECAFALGLALQVPQLR
jgi:hypothetical protein